MEAPDVGHEFALLNRLVPLKVLAPTRVHIRNSRNGAIQPVRQAGWGAGDRKVQPRGTYSSDVRRCCAASPGRGDARRLRRAIDA